MIWLLNGETMAIRIKTVEQFFKLNDNQQMYALRIFNQYCKDIPALELELDNMEDTRPIWKAKYADYNPDTNYMSLDWVKAMCVLHGIPPEHS